MEKQIKYIAVDSGKSNTKYAWFDENKPSKKNISANNFKSVVVEAVLDGVSATDNLLVYRGIAYDVGGADERALESNNSKLTEDHKLFVYTAIAKVLQEMNLGDINETHHIDLSINVPLAEFKSLKDEYIKEYRGKDVTLELNNQEINFVIENVRLGYEGSGAIIRNVDDEAAQSHIVDIGGKNDTHILFQGFKPVPGKNHMTNNGVLTLLQQIASDLSESHDITINEIEKVIEGNLPKPMSFDEIFKRRAKQHVVMIKNQVQKYKINPLFTTIIFSGGGSILLKDQLKKAFEEYTTKFPADAQFDNCKGMLERVFNEVIIT